MENTKIQWHAGFVSAMDLELAKNRSDLIYEREHNLNRKPLEIDLLVIKKDRDTQIENEIGALFRKYNIVEYKSPKDHLDIDTFYKAAGYACLYKAYGESVDARKAKDITVSIIREEKPTGLFRYFSENKIPITNAGNGIYYIMGKVLFPTQIIVTGELDLKEHVWLKALSDNVRKPQMRELLEKIEAFDSKLDRELADSLLEVTVRANWEIVQELRGDENMCQALLELMEPEINKIKKAVEEEAQRTGMQKGIQEGMQKGIKGTVIALRDCGQEDSEIQKAIVRVYNLSAEEAAAYL